MQHNRRTPHHSTTNKKRPAQGLRKGEYQRTVKRTVHALKLIKTGDPDRRLVQTPGAPARGTDAHLSRKCKNRQQPKSTGANAQLNALTACAVGMCELGHSQQKINGAQNAPHIRQMRDSSEGLRVDASAARSVANANAISSRNILRSLSASTKTMFRLTLLSATTAPPSKWASRSIHRIELPHNDSYGAPAHGKRLRRERSVRTSTARNHRAAPTGQPNALVAESHHACAPALPIRSRNDARREHCKHVEQRSSRRRNRSRSVFFADSKSALADACSAAICATTSRHSAFGPSLVAPSLRRRSIFKISACNLRANSPAFTLARRAPSSRSASANTGRSKRANREMIARFMRHLSVAQRPTGGGF